MSSPSRSPSLVSVTSSIPSTLDQDAKLNQAPADTITPAECRIPSGPVDANRSCLQTDKSLEEWAAFEAWKQQHGDPQATSTERPSDPCSDHERFFLPAQNIFFLVSSTFYSVPRAPFEWYSSAFTGKGLSREDPFILDDIKAAQFDHFLSILYPYAYGVYTASTVEDWTAILHLADKWSFQSIRALAITHLLPIATDIEKVILGRQYAISEWLGDAYLALCMRDHSLTKDEGRRMQVDDIIEIYAIRQQFGFGDQLKVARAVLVAEVCARFDLVDSDLPHTGPACTALKASLAERLAVTTPLVSSESAAIHSAHLGNGQGRSTLDAQVSLPYAGDSIALPDPAVAQEEAGAAENTREAAALKRAERERGREMTERALCAFVDPAQNPLYGESDENKQYRLRRAASALEQELEVLRREDCKQEMYDFISSYKAANSELH